MAKITINGTQVKVKKGTTILQAAESIGVEIPTLCFLEEINEIGFCRVCVVKVEGEQDLVSACNTEVTNGMVVETESDEVLNARKTTLALLASRHRFDCWRCPKDGNCEFYDLLKRNDVVFEEFGPGIGRNNETIYGSGISQDQSKCVLCKRCVAVCSEVVTAKVLKFRDEDGTNPTVSPTVGLEFDDAGCIFCGQCVKTCPTGTLFETDHSKQVQTLLQGEDEVVLQYSTPVLSAISEEFGCEPGTSLDNVEGKLVEAARQLGFDMVSDMSVGTDIVLNEMTNTVVEKIKGDGALPVFNSHCPASVRYAELYENDHLEHLSKIKSPHMMQGTLLTKDNKKVVSLLHCVSAKNEIDKDERESVAAVLTVREFAKLVKQASIPFEKLEGLDKDVLFNSTPGPRGNLSIGLIQEVYRALEGEALTALPFKDVHHKSYDSVKGTVKEITIPLKNTGRKFTAAIVHGGAAMKQVYEWINTGKKSYDYVEFMACPGGCMNGGGMPFNNDIDPLQLAQLRKSLIIPKTPIITPQKNEALEDIYKLVEDKTQLETFFTQKSFTKE
jgi:NADP-reducing hydrogenase subunit HndD